MSELRHLKRYLNWQRDWRIADSPLVYLDIETSGLYPRRGQQVYEVALLDSGGVRYYADIKERDRESICEAKEQAMIEELLPCLKGQIVVGHNIMFDLSFIAIRASRFDLFMPTVGVIDTLDLSYRIIPDYNSAYQLINIASYLGVKVPSIVHRALPDAQMAKNIFEKLVLLGEITTLAQANIKKFSQSHEWSALYDEK